MLQSFKLSPHIPPGFESGYWTFPPIKLLSKNKFIFLTKAEVENFYFLWTPLDAGIYFKLKFKDKVKVLEQFLDCFPNPPVNGKNLVDKQKIVAFKEEVYKKYHTIIPI